MNVKIPDNLSGLLRGLLATGLLAVIAPPAVAQGAGAPGDAVSDAAQGDVAGDRAAGADLVSVLPIAGDIDMLTVDGVNIAVQSGPQGMAVVDTGPTGASQAVLAALRKISDGKIRYVIDTSADAELIGGNPPLADAGESLMQNALGRPSGVSVDARIGKVALIVARQDVADRLATQAGYPVWAVPTETFTRPQYNFYLNGEGISVVWMPAAHSSSDTVVLFRRSDVVVTGELVDMTRFPVIDVAHGGSVQGELAALNRLINEFVLPPVPVVTDFESTKVVPARGPLCNQADLVTYRDMIAVVTDRISDQMNHGKSLRQIEASDPTAGYDSRFGAESGEWTTKDFVDAVYSSLASENSKRGKGQKG